MQTMSTAMATLLKSGKQIGANKPTAEVVLGDEGGTRGYINPLVNDELQPKILGYNSVSYMSICAPIDTSDGIFAFAYIHPTTKNVMIGFDEDESFFNSNHTFDSVIDTGINVDIDLSSIVIGMSNLSFFKRTDGKILLFVNDLDSISDTYYSVKCYVSDSGNCTDFGYLSTLREWIGTITQSNTGHTNMTIPVQVGDDIFVAFSSGFISTYFEFTNIVQGLYIYKSNDNGVTWTLIKSYQNTSYTYEYIGQIAELSDGTLYCEMWQYPATTYGVVSSDNGVTWSAYQLDEGVSSWDTGRGTSVYYDESTDILYKTCTSGIWKLENPTYAKLTDLTSWEYMHVGEGVFSQYAPSQIRELDSKNIAITYSTSGDSRILGMDFTPTQKTLQAKSITVNRSKGMAGGLTLELDNKAAILAPDGTANPQLLWPNKEVVVKQGYGEELLKTFTGLIDSISMSRDEQGVASVTVSARDKLKVALDHLIRNQDFLYTLTYTNMLVEDMWKNLVGLAGLTYNTVEATGLTISEKTFSWETYADAFSWLDEIAGFETYCDEDGNLNFVWDGRPSVVTTAYSFVEGVDITRLGYEINDVDLYYTVAVYGKSPEVLDENDEVVTESMVIYFAKQLPQATYWNIPSGKVLRIDAPDADTQAKCEIIADKAIYLMQTRARQVTFSTIGIPHLQRGDFIQVEESSTTISEIYRITDITTQQGPDGYSMTLTCYYHAAPEVV